MLDWTFEACEIELGKLMVNICEDIYENFYHAVLLKLALRWQKIKTVYAKCTCLQARHVPGPRLPSVRNNYVSHFFHVSASGKL